MQRSALIRTPFWLAGLALVTASCFSQTPPTIRSVVNSADYSQGLVEMSLGTILGDSLAADTATAASDVLPVTLANTSVSICIVKPPRDLIPGAPVTGCSLAALLFVSPWQINFEVPGLHDAAAVDGAAIWLVAYSAIGGVDANSARGDPYQTFTRVSDPAVFQAGFDCYFGATDPEFASVPCMLTAQQISPNQALRGVLTDPPGNLVTSRNPMRTGTNYTIWLTGLDSRSMPPAQVDVVLEREGQLFPASSMQGISQASSTGVHHVVFEVPPLFDSGQPCTDRKADVAVEVLQTVSGVRYSSRPVNAPVLVLAGDIPCANP
jgi:uncharacterized protein (TIGR03437 family)